MSPLKWRQLLIRVHLCLAAFLTPVFVLVAVTGGLEIAGIEGKLRETEIVFSEDARLDMASPILKEEVEQVLTAHGVRVDTEYLRVRGDRLTTVPTTRPFVRLHMGPDGLTGTLQEPDLLYGLLELHKGRGPRLFQFYQIAAAIALCLIILGGLAIGLMVQAYRSLTIGVTVVGALFFGFAGFVL